MKAAISRWCFALGISFSILGVQAAELEEAPLVDGLKDLKVLDKQLVSISESCSQATVALLAKNGGGTGSGVVVSEDGLVLTAAHVVEAMRGGVVVIFPDGSRKDGKVLGGEYDRDAAMVQITEPGDYPFVELAEEEMVQRNQWCVALGHPGGFDPNRTPPIRLGRVISKENFIVTDCAVVGGDSGGPLFDVEGRLIGIHSNIGASLSQNRHVPLYVFRERWDEMKEGQRQGSRFGNKGSAEVDLERPVIGVQLGEPGPRGGVRVTGVLPGSPAEKAGIKEGDLIMAIGGKKVAGREALIEVAGTFKAGRRVKVVLLREGKRKRVDLKLVKMGDLMERGEGGSSEEEAGEKDSSEERSNGKDRRPKQGEGQAELDLEDLLKKSMQRGGRLELTPEQLKLLGGQEELAAKLRELVEKMSPEEMAELAKRAASMETVDPFFASVVKALKPVVSPARKSTVAVLADGKLVSLGTVVSEDGWILTKNEETAKGELKVRVGDKLHEAELVERFPRRDLALFAIDADDLEPVEWADIDRELPLGKLLTSPSPAGEAMGIGLVSVRERAFADAAFLGIRSGESDQGVVIEQVVPKSSAAKSGLKRGDVIVELDGDSVSDPIEFGNRVRSLKAGDEIAIRFLRDGESSELEVELGARPEGPTSDRFRRMNEMAGPLSSKVSGYPEALQHDMPLRPEQCGGPILNLKGECVGINVSRAGRVKTLAIPAGDVLELLEGIEEEASGDEDLEAVRELIEEMQDNLSELKERLEELEAR